MAQLLVVHHSPGRSMTALLDAALEGTRDELVSGVDVVVRDALDFTVDDVLAADGYLLASTANFGYMSGALKHFFDSTFLAVGGSLDPSGSAAGGGGHTAGRPFGLYVHGRYDQTGAVRSVLSITGALGWRQAARVLTVSGDVTREHSDAAYELGATLAAVVAEAL